MEDTAHITECRIQEHHRLASENAMVKQRLASVLLWKEELESDLLSLQKSPPYELSSKAFGYESLKCSHVNGSFKFHTDFNVSRFDSIFSFPLPDVSAPPLSSSKITQATRKLTVQHQLLFTLIKLQLSSKMNFFA